MGDQSSLTKIAIYISKFGTFTTFISDLGKLAQTGKNTSFMNFFFSYLQRHGSSIDSVEFLIYKIMEN